MTPFMLGIIIALMVWILSDGVYSWTLYLNAPSYEGLSKQTFWRDHWVRLVRIIVSVAVLVICLKELQGV